MTPDQVIEVKHTLAGLAEILRSYYDELREQGYSADEALKIVVDYQRSLT